MSAEFRHGWANELKGEAKEVAGAVTFNRDLKERGEAQKLHGKAERADGKSQHAFTHGGSVRHEAAAQADEAASQQYAADAAQGSYHHRHHHGDRF
ncbi:hypothetical protein HDV00_004407 [Rhizophlyctis rosea]|nr:hypothetical protein HDV00_004407 [Rhizophlyctis rosea]